jgi:hypothetical protein
MDMEKKKCTKCGEEKVLNEYAYKNKPKEIKKPHCKECDKKARREYYLKNKDRIVGIVMGNNKKIKERNGRFVWNYLLEHPCIGCGETNPIVLEFDHRDGSDKTIEVSKMVNLGYSVENIKNEIAKCDIRCANCHRIRTAKQFNWYSYI